MNAIDDNSFTQTLSKLGQKIRQWSHEKEQPIRAILCISAHWETSGTWITHMPSPRTIHDFGGFPQALFDVSYPAPGSPKIADQICSILASSPTASLNIQKDDGKWGLDHGTWSVLTHLFPLADIPVLQLSLDQTQKMEFHFQLGQKLRELRQHGILILGSGNIVHNLQRMNWDQNARPWDFSTEFDEGVKKHLIERNYQPLWQNLPSIKGASLSVPTNEHYSPLLYVLGASTEEDQLQFEFEGIHHGAISMRSFSLGMKG